MVCGLSRTQGLLYYIRGQSAPITLLVFEQVLTEHCCGTVLLGHMERGFFKFMVFGKATIRRRGFAEDFLFLTPSKKWK